MSSDPGTNYAIMYYLFSILTMVTSQKWKTTALNSMSFPLLKKKQNNNLAFSAFIFLYAVLCKGHWTT